MVYKQLCPSARIYVLGAPGNGSLAGRMSDCLTAGTSATQGITACRQGALYSRNMRVETCTGFPGASVLSHKRPSGNGEARMTQQSLKVIMEKATLSLGPLLAGFVDLDKKQLLPRQGIYHRIESVCERKIDSKRLGTHRQIDVDLQTGKRWDKKVLLCSCCSQHSAFL